MAESCDVNRIIDHFRQTGQDPHAERLQQQQFGYASSQTYSEALRATAEISSAFHDLSSETRSRFSNDPALWLDSLATLEPAPKEIVAPEPSEAPSPEKIEAKTAEKAKIDST